MARRPDQASGRLERSKRSWSLPAACFIPRSRANEQIRTGTPSSSLSTASRASCRGIECPADGGQHGIQLREAIGQSVEVGRVRVGDQVQILGAAYVSVRGDRDAADHGKLNVATMQDLEQSAEVEFGQRPEAAPLMALICLLRL